MLRLIPQKLTRHAFAPFGQIIQEEADDSFAINGGTSLRMNDLARIETDPLGHPLFSLFICRVAISLPHRPDVLECHPLGSQAFLPRSPARFLVLVAPAGPKPDLKQLQCFLTDGQQGVNYAPGIWHLPLGSLSPATYVVIDRGGPGDNCQEVTVSGKIEIMPS